MNLLVWSKEKKISPTDLRNKVERHSESRAKTAPEEVSSAKRLPCPLNGGSLRSTFSRQSSTDASFPHWGPLAVLSAWKLIAIETFPLVDWIILQFLGGVCVCDGGTHESMFLFILRLVSALLLLFCLFETLFIYFKEPMAGSVINHVQEMDW